MAVDVSLLRDEARRAHAAAAAGEGGHDGVPADRLHADRAFNDLVGHGAREVLVCRGEEHAAGRILWYGEGESLELCLGVTLTLAARTDRAPEPLDGGQGVGVRAVEEREQAGAPAAKHVVDAFDEA